MWQKIKKNFLFKTLSSVKLAVPLLILTAGAILAGTILESRYNAEYAKMMVYDTPWFFSLFGLIGLNIIFAALSRIPWRKGHTGFVITHTGMTILLIGSWMTYQDGIDGSLSVQEQGKSSSVVLSERVVEVVGKNFFKKMLVEKKPRTQGSEEFKEVNNQFFGFIEVERYHPFVKPLARQSHTGGPGIAFSIKSNFFDENLFLDLENQREVNLGPATFRVIPFGEEGFKEKTVVQSKVKRKPSQVESKEETVVIKDSKTQKVLKNVSVSSLEKGISLNQYSVKILQKFKNGVVVDNKIAEGQGGINPVLEVEVTQGNNRYREIVYAKFPDFALMNNPGMPFKFIYKSSLLEAESTATPHQADPHQTAKAEMPASGPGNGSNVVEFQLLDSFENYQKKLNSGEKVKVRVLLIKKDKIVQNQEIAISDKLETPWMGMVLTLNELKFNATAPQSLDPIVYNEPPLFENNLPPSALVVRVKNMEKPVWLIEGQVQEVMIDGESYQLYYGRNILQLPFSVHLDKFSKRDYKGTETAMSFESRIRINDEKDSILVSMNEPLKRDGFTLYQSSYQLQPNAPAISIFSVNRDPGRPIKYLGSLVMAIGIIIYTYMRSRFYRKA